MSSRWIRVCVAAAAAALFTTGFVLAQQAATDESKRKVKSKTAPAYPELARRMNVAGKLRIGRRGLALNLALAFIRRSLLRKDKTRGKQRGSRSRDTNSNPSRTH